MPAPFQARVAWTTRPNRADAQTGTRKGVAVHWPGFRFTLGKHAECLGLVARLEREAIAGTYAAIPYNELICPHGYRIEGRGASRRSGANGNTTANKEWGSVCCLLPIGGKPTEAMLEAVLASLTVQAPGGRLVTHNDVRGRPTMCPGPDLTEWVRAGAPAPAKGKQGRYVVQRGDTLWSIAERHYGKGSAWQRIATANKLKETDELRLGQVLVLP